MARRDVYLEHLSSIPIFGPLSRRELEKVARASDELKIPAGRDLVTQGQVGREAFVLVEGSATVRRNGRKVTTLGPGAAIGELSLLDRGPRTATVTADGDCTVLVLGAREFAGLLDEVPSIARKILAALASEVRELDTKVYG
ncbi:MAG: cyclic nucleotide-binding domain-containing protein [Acidimicrobiales bacterium]